MKIAATTFLFTAMASLGCSVFAQGDPAAGQQLVVQGDGQGGAPCLACHGLDGAGMAAAGFPALAHLEPGYMVKQMQDYQSGKRPSVVMAPSVARFTPQQLQDVAAWYASQQPQPTAVAELPAEQLALGETLATEGDWERYIVPCESCHGPGNSGVGSEFPALAGQHASYIKQQLLAWQNGTRSNDPQQLMLAIAARLSPNEIDAVAEYLSRLPAGDL